MELTRREWQVVVASTLVSRPLARAFAPQAIDSTIAGVRMGAQSYSFRDRPLDEMIAAMRTIGLGNCELWQGHVEPRQFPDAATRDARREAMRSWRLSVPLDEFRGIRRKFDRAGIALTAYNLSFTDDFNDAEIERGFEMARALGVDVITASSNVTTAARLDPVAERFKIRVGFHNHSNVAPNEFSGPDDFRKALEGRSNMLAINLDIGHFTAANHDAVAFLDENHDRIVSLHIKDRRRDQGPNVPLGEGDTPIAAVLTRLRDRRWPIPVNIEYEYRGADTVAEVRRCFEYCSKVLTG